MENKTEDKAFTRRTEYFEVYDRSFRNYLLEMFNYLTDVLHKPSKRGGEGKWVLVFEKRDHE